jgi:hypothetical protein
MHSVMSQHQHNVQHCCSSPNTIPTQQATHGQTVSANTHSAEIANGVLLAKQANLIARFHWSLRICYVHKDDAAVAWRPASQLQPLVVDVDK